MQEPAFWMGSILLSRTLLHITKQFSESIMRKNNQTTLDSEKAEESETETRKR